MTYRPRETVFGPPLSARLPSLFYLAFALGVVAFVLLGEQADSNSWWFNYVVAEDVRRVMKIRTFAVILLISALASLIRAGMRGVRIYPDGVETRDVLSFILPRLKRYRWPQIERIVFDQKTVIALDLWDGSRAFLPAVGEHDKLAAALERVAAARAIPVRGGTLDSEIEGEADAEDGEM